jgi:mono/diheme cytochrome c family protein
MMNGLCLAGLVCLALLGGALMVRNQHVGNRIVRRIGLGASFLVTLAATIAAALMVAGMMARKGRAAPVPELSIAATPAVIERGEVIANSFCAGCHSRLGSLQGGGDFGHEFSLPLGSFVPANLTPAGPLRHWSDGQVFRAIRNQVDAEGHWLMIMSYTNVGRLSDADIEAVIAYLRSVPARGDVTSEPADRLSALGLAMLGAGLLPKSKPVFTGVITAPPQGPSALYGDYVAAFSGCHECHGATLSGRQGDGLAPAAPGLRQVRTWAAAQFLATLRTGIDPYGHELSTAMPWQSFGKLSDDDLTALYEHVIATVGPESASSARR